MLIKSLTGPEKGYFKKFARLHVRGDGNNYIRLFEIISRSKEYDEIKAGKYFSNGTFEKQLADQKQYLYNLILKSLRNYYSSTSIDEYLVDRIRNARILQRKGFYRAALSELDKIKKKALDFDSYPLVVLIVRIQRQIIDMWHSPFQIKKYMQRIDESEKKAVAMLQSTVEYKAIFDRLYMFVMTKGMARQKEDFIFLKNIIRSPVMHIKHPSPFEQYSILYVSVIYFYTTGDFLKAYHAQKKVLSVSEQKFRHQKKYFTDYTACKSYLSALGNMLEIQNILQKYTESLFTLRKLKDLKKDPLIARSEDLCVHIFIQYYPELSIYNGLGDYNKSLILIPSLLKELERYRGKIRVMDELLLYFFIAGAYFGSGQYHEALKWVNRILSFPKKMMRENDRSFAIILNLVIHFEMGNYDLIFSLYRSAYRYLLGKKSRVLEKTILEFIRKSISPTALKNNYKKDTLKKLFALANDPSERIGLTYFDFVTWVESKIENRPFAEVIRGKALQRK